MKDMTDMEETGLALDARQRAMLDEMGVKVWWPMKTAPAALAPVEAVSAIAIAPAAEASAPATARQPAPVAAAPADHAASAPPAARVPSAATAPPASPAPSSAASSHGASVLVEAPRRLYATAADATTAEVRGGWLIVADMPPEADGRHGEPFAGEAGRLLDNMLRALQLHAGATPVHLMRTHRGVASGREGSPRPFGESFAAFAQPLAPRVVLAMGSLAAQRLLQSSEPLGRLRGRAAPSDAMNGAPVVVTYHPAYLLRNPADKARAWADLCLAAEQISPLP